MYDFTYVILSTRQNDRDRKQPIVAKSWKWEEGLCTEGHEKLEGSVGYMIVYICQNSQNCLLKWVIFTVYKLYLD